MDAHYTHTRAHNSTKETAEWQAIFSDVKNKMMPSNRHNALVSYVLAALVTLAAVGGGAAASLSSTASRSKSSSETFSSSLSETSTVFRGACRSAALLSIDPDGGYVTVADFAAQPSGWFLSSAAPPLLRNSSSVTGILVSNNVTQSLATRLCLETYGAPFEADGVTTGSSLTAQQQYSSRGGSSSLSFWTVVCPPGVLYAANDGVVVPVETVAIGPALDACSICPVLLAATATTTTVAMPVVQVTCRSRVALQPAEAMTSTGGDQLPLRLAFPPQWRNATIDASTLPTWLLQQRQPAGLCSNSPNTVASLSVGGGVLGSLASGYVSGIDVSTVPYGEVQFGLRCQGGNATITVVDLESVFSSSSTSSLATRLFNTSTTSSSSCSVVPLRRLSERNTSAVAIVSCMPTSNGTVPLNRPGDVFPAGASCWFRYAHMAGGLLAECSWSSVVESSSSAAPTTTTTTTTTPSPTTTSPEGNVSTTTIPSPPPNPTAATPTPTTPTTTSATLSVCMRESDWLTVGARLCLLSGFDTAALVTTIDGGTPPSVEQDPRVLRMECPATRLLTKLVRQNFSACGRFVTPRSSIPQPSPAVAGGSSSSSSSSSCVIRTLRCEKLPVPQPAVDWMIGSIVFCSAIFIVVVVSCVQSAQYVRAVREGRSLSQAKTRLRRRSTSTVSTTSNALARRGTSVANVRRPSLGSDGTTVKKSLSSAVLSSTTSNTEDGVRNRSFVLDLSHRGASVEL